MNNKKVVLYFPRVFSDTRPWHRTPLALLAVSSLLVTDGYDVHIIADFLFEDHIAEVIHQCQDSMCLGLTCMTGFQIYDALRIADAVRASRPDLPIVWGGWYPSILPEETENVIFIGPVDNRDIYPYFNAADILVIPSQYEEGVARVMLEALSSGTPVVDSNRGTIPSILDSSVSILV